MKKKNQIWLTKKRWKRKRNRIDWIQNCSADLVFPFPGLFWQLESDSSLRRRRRNFPQSKSQSCSYCCEPRSYRKEQSRISTFFDNKVLILLFPVPVTDRKESFHLEELFLPAQTRHFPIEILRLRWSLTNWGKRQRTSKVSDLHTTNLGIFISGTNLLPTVQTRWAIVQTDNLYSCSPNSVIFGWLCTYLCINIRWSLSCSTYNLCATAAMTYVLDYVFSSLLMYT